MKKFLFIAAMAFVATATFAQDAPKQDAPVATKKDATVATKKAKKPKKVKATAAAAAAVIPVSSRPAPPVSAAPIKAAAVPVASSANDKGSKAGMKFETDVIDYGTIKQNSDRVRHFTFTNTGTEPLIIKNAQGSCGCTVPTYPHEPIMPNQKASIDVNYDTNRVGQFTKTVTLTTNADGQETKVLTIKGNVEAAPAAPGTAAPVAPAGH